MATTTKVNEFVNDWTEKIKNAVKLRDKVTQLGDKAFLKRLNDARKYYRGDWKKNVIPVNRIFSFGRSMIPAVYFRSPRVVVTAKRPEFEVHARVVEAIDNWMIEETNLKQTLKRSALDAYLGGVGPIKMGYDSEFGYIPSQAVLEDTATVTQYSRTESRVLEYNAAIKPGMPWALPELPENIIVPFGYRDPDTMPWIAVRILRPIDDVKQDQKYKNTKDLQGTRLVELDTKGNRSTLRTGEDLKYAELIEIRDASTRQIHVICENNILLSDQDALQVERLPWEFIIFNQDPEFFWGIPDVSMLEPQQLELNDTRTQDSRHRKIALLKFLFKKGAIERSQLENFFSDDVGIGVEIDDDVIASAVQMLQPHVPPDLSVAAQIIKDDMRETLGFSENQLGAFSPYHNKSATETIQVAQSYDNRLQERRDIVADVVARIVKTWNQWIFKFWTGEKIIQIAGPEGAQNWVRFTGDELIGEYALHVDPDSGFPISKGMKMEAAGKLFAALNGDQLINQTGLRQLFLSQYEWLYPSIQGLLNVQMPEDVANLVSVARQPHPGGVSGLPSGGNRGGGRSGSSPEQPMELEEYRRRMEASK